MKNHQQSVCKNCQQELKGKFCFSCGEKVVENKDFSIKSMLLQVLDGFTNVDAKAFKTIKLLLIKPGKLTTNYVNGIRIPFMKPFQIFLISNVLFFLILSDADIFREPAKWFFKVSNNIESLSNLSDKSGIEKSEFIKIYDRNSLNNSKSFLIILIPVFAVVFSLLHYKKKLQFGKHLVFATHYFSFFIIFILILASFPMPNKYFLQVPIFMVNFIYLTFAFKEFYKNNWLLSIFKGFLGIILVIFITLIYRREISTITFYLMDTF